MKEKFIQFLKDNGALEKFKAAMRDDNVRFADVISTTIGDWMFECGDPVNYIDIAFDWRRSKNGYEYWDDIDNKWMKSL